MFGDISGDIDGISFSIIPGTHLVINDAYTAWGDATTEQKEFAFGLVIRFAGEWLEASSMKMAA